MPLSVPKEQLTRVSRSGHSDRVGRSKSEVGVAPPAAISSRDGDTEGLTS